MSTSMKRCPQYTYPGTGPYDTATGFSIAPAPRNAAGRADRRRVVGGERISTEHVTVETVTDLVDRLPAHELGSPQVAAHDMVEQLTHRPLFVDRRSIERISRDAGDQRAGRVEGASVHLGKVDGHRNHLGERSGARRRYANRRPGGGGRPRQHSPSMKIQERRWIALGPYPRSAYLCTGAG